MKNNIAPQQKKLIKLQESNFLDIIKKFIRTPGDISTDFRKLTLDKIFKIIKGASQKTTTDTLNFLKIANDDVGNLMDYANTFPLFKNLASKYHNVNSAMASAFLVMTFAPLSKLICQTDEVTNEEEVQIQNAVLMMISHSIINKVFETLDLGNLKKASDTVRSLQQNISLIGNIMSGVHTVISQGGDVVKRIYDLCGKQLGITEKEFSNNIENGKLHNIEKFVKVSFENKEKAEQYLEDNAGLICNDISNRLKGGDCQLEVFENKDSQTYELARIFNATLGFLGKINEAINNFNIPPLVSGKQYKEEDPCLKVKNLKLLDNPYNEDLVTVLKERNKELTEEFPRFCKIITELYPDSKYVFAEFEHTGFYRHKDDAIFLNVNKAISNTELVSALHHEHDHKAQFDKNKLLFDKKSPNPCTLKTKAEETRCTKLFNNCFGEKFKSIDFDIKNNEDKKILESAIGVPFVTLYNPHLIEQSDSKDLEISVEAFKIMTLTPRTILGAHNTISLISFMSESQVDIIYPEIIRTSELLAHHVGNFGPKISNSIIKAKCPSLHKVLDSKNKDYLEARKERIKINNKEKTNENKTRNKENLQAENLQARRGKEKSNKIISDL